MDRTEVIQKALKRLGGNNYLEIGMAEGHNFNKIKCKNKIGIDPVIPSIKIRINLCLSRFIPNRNVKYYQTTSNKFFNEKAKSIFKNTKIDVAFIDGLHHYEQALKDVMNCLDYLKDRGVIIMHDCNPTTKEMQIVPRIQEEWTGDVWKTIVQLRSLNTNLDAFVLNCDYGLGIITKRKSEKKLGYTPNQIKKMSYKDLKNNRIELLNLKEESYLNKFLSIL